MTNYYTKQESDVIYQSDFKQSASSTSRTVICTYDNIRVSVRDASDGKWLYLSGATSTSLNGYYSHSWENATGSGTSRGLYYKTISGLLKSSWLRLSVGAEKYNATTRTPAPV